MYSLNLTHLVGSDTLKPYMHGYFIDLRLYTKAKAIANPFAYAEHRDKLIRDKLAAEQESRIRGAKKQSKSAETSGIKVNKTLAKKIKELEERQRKKEAGIVDDEDEDDEKRKKRKRKADKMADQPSLLKDDRFGAIFENPDFEIDEESREFQLLNPSTKPNRNRDNEDDSDVEENEEASDSERSENGEDDSDSDSSIGELSSPPLFRGVDSPLLLDRQTSALTRSLEDRTNLHLLLVSNALPLLPPVHLHLDRQQQLDRNLPSSSPMVQTTKLSLRPEPDLSPLMNNERLNLSPNEHEKLLEMPLRRRNEERELHRNLPFEQTETISFEVDLEELWRCLSYLKRNLLMRRWRRRRR